MKQKSAKFTTIKKWSIFKDFCGETTDEGHIMILVSKLRRDNLAHVRNKDRLRKIKKGSVNQTKSCQ